MINGLTDSPQRIEPLLATLALVEEVSDRLCDQFVTASIVAVNPFLFDLFVKSAGSLCQGKVEMSPFAWASGRVHVILRVPVKRRRALLASNPIEE